MKRYTTAGILATVTYVGLAAFLVWSKRDGLGTLELNEWGDSLAGIFAPVAFFWLVLGYVQQGDELQQNTEALQEQQKELMRQVLHLNRQATAAEQTILSEAASREIDLAHLVLVATGELDRYASQCLSVAYDDGTEEGQPAGSNDEHVATVDVPMFDPLALKVNWQVLREDLLQEVFHLPERAARVSWAVQRQYDLADQPTYTQYFWERRQRYAQLGLFVSNLVRDLQQLVALPPLRSCDAEFGIDRTRDAELHRMIDAVAAARERVRLSRVEHHRRRSQEGTVQIHPGINTDQVG